MLVKRGEDPLAMRAMIGITCAIATAPVALWIGVPTTSMALWLAASVAVHLVYQLALVRSYELSDFSVAFPVARAVAPLGTAAASVVAFGEILAVPALFALGAITLGLLVLADRRLIGRSGLAMALVTGLLTTGYTLVDAAGVRAAADPLQFIAWFFLLEGIGIVLIFTCARRGASLSLLSIERRAGMLAGIISLFGFGAALYALRLAPVGLVSGLRESSVAFAMLLAALFLGERMTPRKIVACLLITLGAASAALV